MKTNLLTLAITLTVGIILAGSLLMPVISDAQKTLGDPIEYTNGGSTPIFLDYYDEDFTMTLDGTDKTATIGDYTVPTSTATPRIMFWEYGRINLDTPSSAYVAYLNDYRSGSALAISGDSEIKYDAANHKLTVTTGGDDHEYTANTVMTLKEDGKYVFQASNGIGSAYYLLDNIENGTLGFLDTTTTYDGGSIEVVYNKSGITVYGLAEGTDYTATIDIVGGTKVDGTYEIYQGGTPTFTIQIGDDTVVESTYRYGQAVIYKVEGHATDGAAHDLIGVLPLLVIVALVIMAIGAIYIKRDD